MNSIQGSSMTNPEILHTFNDLVNRKDWKGLDTFLSLPELRSLLPKELVQEFKALIESKVGMETEANLRRTIQSIRDSIRSVREHSPDERAESLSYGSKSQAYKMLKFLMEKKDWATLQVLIEKPDIRDQVSANFLDRVERKVKAKILESKMPSDQTESSNSRVSEFETLEEFFVAQKSPKRRLKSLTHRRGKSSFRRLSNLSKSVKSLVKISEQGGSQGLPFPPLVVGNGERSNDLVVKKEDSPAKQEVDVVEARSNIISTDELLKIVLTRDMEKLRSFVDQNQIPDNFITSVKDFMNSPENAKKDADKEHHRDRSKARAKPSISREESPESTDESLLIPSKGSSSRRKKSKSRYQTSLQTLAEEGDIMTIRFLLEKKRIKPNDMVLTTCISAGNLELLKMLTKYPEIKITYSTLEEAARHGQLDMVKFFIQDYSLTPDKRILDDAAYGGNVNLVKYLLEKYPLFPDINTLHMAVRSGSSNDLEMTKFLVEKHKLVPDERAIFFALNDHNMDLYTYLIESRELMRSNHNRFGSNKMMKKELSESARNGNLEFVKFLILEKGVRADQGTLKAATESGNLNLVKYLTSSGDRMPDLEIMPDLECLQISLKRGHLEIAKHYIETYNLVATKEMLDAAASNGRRDIIEYLSHDLKIMPDIVTLNQAVSTGKYDTAKYLMETHQITPDQTTQNYANFYGSLPLQKLISSYHNKALISESIHRAVTNDKQALDSKEIIKNPRRNRFLRLLKVPPMAKKHPKVHRPKSLERHLDLGTKTDHSRSQRSKSLERDILISPIKSTENQNSLISYLSPTPGTVREDPSLSTSMRSLWDDEEEEVVPLKGSPRHRSRRSRSRERIIGKTTDAQQRSKSWDDSFKGSSASTSSIFEMSFRGLELSEAVSKNVDEARPKSDPFVRSKSKSISEPVNPNLPVANRKKIGGSHSFKLSHGKKLIADQISRLKPLSIKVPKHQNERRLKSTGDDDDRQFYQKRKSKVKESGFQKPQLLRQTSGSSLNPVSGHRLATHISGGSDDDSIEVKKPKSEPSLGKFFKKTKKSDDYGSLDDDSLESDF